MAQDWKKWFEGYATDWTEGRLKAVSARYAPVFQAIKPNKSATYHNDEGFESWLDNVRKFHVEAGLKSVEIVTTHVSHLGGTFAMVSVMWAVRFERRATRRIQFEISYLVADRDAENPTILTIVSHQDQRAAMRQNDVLPGRDQKALRA